MLEIIYQDEYLIAINKPHDLLVHRSSIAADVQIFALQLLRDQVGKMVMPVHRLDRKTGGVLLFAFDKETERTMQQKFSNAEMEKKYLAIVRGYTPESGIIDYALRKENGTLQDAITEYVRLEIAEIPYSSGQHETSRYSLLEIIPKTGRMHQIRKHLSHILHPIIADRPHGCNKQNRFFLQNFELNTMLLHAASLKFEHPVSKEIITIKANLQPEFVRIMNLMNWKLDDFIAKSN